MRKQNTLIKSSPLKMAYTNGAAAAAATFVNSTGTISSSAAIPIRGNIVCEGDQCIDVEFTKVCRPLYVLEKHLSVIRKGPTSPPKIEMYSWEDDADISGDDLITIETTFTGDLMPVGTGSDGTDISIFYNPNKELKTFGVPNNLVLPISLGNLDWNNNHTLLITHRYINNFGIQVTATCRAKIDSVGAVITCTILAITNNFPITATTAADVYLVKVEQIPPLFEVKFPKFSYRYKYEDGEYSVFAPWSEIAFMPGDFDFLPKKGYNLGMVNTMRSLRVKDWRPKSMPGDVIEIDLLYKESNSPNVYTVETFKKDDPSNDENKCPDNLLGSLVNPWHQCGNGDNFGNYEIDSELIHKVVPANQMLRPWDNVPRKALGQEITANRIIYANYLQNYDVKDDQNQEIKPTFGFNVIESDYSITSENYDPNDDRIKLPMKSLKSMRTYQIGVVYRDKYGRETPVLTSKSGSIEISKSQAKLQNKLNVVMTSEAPDWAESYTFYLKETSNEYYNLAMDRWYNAEDDGVWLSFPSSERNKVSDRSILILKKQHNTDMYVDVESKYKVLAIENNAPTFIKTEYKFWGSLPMMLPPPGWGEGGKPGGWDTGMFHSTGLPLPNRLYVDIYAEYWDQSVLNELQSQGNGAQIRITQHTLATTSYNATPSSSSNKSRWYDVARVSVIGSPPEVYEEETTDSVGNVTITEIEVPGQAEQIVRVTLEELMGDDMAFCESNDNLSLSRGLSIEARTKTVRDKAQFEGRFFVKVLRDSSLQTNIVQPGQTTTDFWQVLMTKNIKYICAAHPGVQEACAGATGTPGDSKGKYYGFEGSSYNYLPPSKNFGKPWYVADGMSKKYLVSSLSKAAGDASYLDAVNAPLGPPQIAGDHWPHGPSILANPVFVSGWWFNQYNEYVDNNITNLWNSHVTLNPIGTPGYGTFNPPLNFGGPNDGVFLNNAKTENDWPAFMPSDWEPITCDANDCTTIGDNDFATGNFSGGIDTATRDYSTGNSLRGSNAYHVPAIWGDESDLLGYTGDPSDSANNLIVNTGYTVSGPTTGPPSMWKLDTIEKLRKNWYYLWHGRDKICTTWPLGRFTPERWFFDKVGAARGYSGNGIWTDTTQSTPVSKISLSYYGIGSLNARHLSHDMLTFQENESAFGILMATPGTQFRFKNDPYSVIYTVTQSEIENVMNYETGYGSWGTKDPDNPDECIGGGNMGSNQCPPWGGKNISTNSIAGKEAFLSQLFNSHRELTGGAPYNYRVRVTLTLDREIGVGPDMIPIGTANMGFHPLLNHVDVDGNCNIEDGPQIYWDGSGGGNEPEWIGGTALELQQDVLPTENKFYNLSSYWNYTGGSGSAPTEGQGSTIGSGDSDGQHFGLHERGLNSTAIEIVTAYNGDETNKPMSTNPAVWETEPMEDVGLDIYYAASPSYPINLKRFRSDEFRPDESDIDSNGNYTNAHWFDYNWRGEEMVIVGATVQASPGPNAIVGNDYSGFATVVGVQGNRIWTDSAVVKDAGGNASSLASEDILTFLWKGEGAFYGAHHDDMLFSTIVDSTDDVNIFRIVENTHDKLRTLPYFNCYTFSNGVESNRIRDDYNAVTIDKGVKASMPLAEQYKEERRPSSLIFSGIYNSTSGINRTNQFIQAEAITKDLNPINGSIQKLFARDTDLVTFCENKVFKILANKDALFNADGNTNVTSNKSVLGQLVPFSGEYGISKNPESLASESYRIYFADKDRGAILRLSKDGLTPISDYGMKDWFKDNLKFATSIIGSVDNRNDQYNVTVETADRDGNDKAYTLSYTEDKKGWVSFKSFVHQGGVSHKNVYYTFPSNTYSTRIDSDPWGIPYSSGTGSAETYQHDLDLEIKRTITSAAIGSSTIVYSPNPLNIILVGMNIEGNGIPYGTVVGSVISDSSCTVSPLPVYIDEDEEIRFTAPRNRFYELNHYSMIKTLFNKDQGSVKRFKTINYEGSQAQVVPKYEDGIQTSNFYQIEGVNVGAIYLDNYQKEGWHAHDIKTDLQEGTIKEFVDKENKWFDYIRGKEANLSGDELDTGDFSLQGIGIYT